MKKEDWLLGKPPITTKLRDVHERIWQPWLDAALEEAIVGLKEGGLPIGSVLVDEHGNIVAKGHNLRVQTGDPTAHAEVACIRNAGRRRDWHTLTLVSTLSPCIMCTGPLCFIKSLASSSVKIKISWGRKHYLETMDAQSFMPMITAASN